MKLLRSVYSAYGLQIAVLVLAIFTFVLTSPGFGSVSGLFASLSGFAFVGLVAAGVAVTMIAGELDLSAASIAALAAVLSILFEPLGLVGAIVAATILSAFIGLIQGWIIGKLRINSLVFTVATNILIRGAAWIISGNQPVVLKDFKFSDPLLVRWGFLSPGILVSAFVFLLLGVFLAITRWGREIYAVGGARVEARAAGVPVTRSIAVAFAVSGACAGIAGSMAAIRGASATPDGFQDLVLAGVAAAVIGGISLYGGRGTMVNVALGVGTVSVLAAGMTARGAQSYVTQLVTGLLLFLIIGIKWGDAKVRGRRQNPVQGEGSFDKPLAINEGVSE